jgi:hypothetical protein
MNKKIAMFLFALGMGASVAATADTCMYHCQAQKMNCMNTAGSDQAARSACYDQFLECVDSCGM